MASSPKAGYWKWPNAPEKLNPRDRMGLLLVCCQDCIEAVSIYPLTPIEDA